MTAAGDPNLLLREAFACHQQGRLSEAEQGYRRVLQIDPNQIDALNLLGLACLQVNKPREAEGLLRRAVALDPNFSEAHSHLGGALQGQGRLEEALACFQRAVALKKDNVAAWVNLADVQRALGRLDEAMTIAAPLVDRFPEQAWPVMSNIGVSLTQASRYSDAAECFRRVIRARPDLVEGHRNLGEILRELRKHDDAIACFRQALKLDPARADIHSLLLFTLQVHPTLGNQAIFDEHRRFDRQHAAPLASLVQPHTNERSPGRRPLRVGYVSPDFREHAVAFFIEPVLAHHDRENFQIVCYQCAPYQDEVTARLRNLAHAWRDLAGVSDERAAEMIRADGIDVLVDLAAHSKGNRLLIFARKPAPVQVTYLGYAGTTGLSAMDYRLTDSHVDPPGTSEPFHSEELLRLPRTLWCFRPSAGSPAVGEPPCTGSDRITFGSANALTKINSLVLEQWAQILRAVPDSRLALKARGLEDPAVQRELAGELKRLGVDPVRLEFHGWSALAGYLDFFSRIDIALDAFPFAGGTTTCHALWMGVPTITLVQDRSVCRVGASIVANMNLPEFIARTSEQYVRLAAELARDRGRLAELRRTLRDRMESSPLRDEVGVTRDIENAYRQIWQRWCGNV